MEKKKKNYEFKAFDSKNNEIEKNEQVNDKSFEQFMNIIRVGVALAGGNPNDLSGWTIEEIK